MTPAQRALLERIEKQTEVGADYFPVGNEWRSMTVLQRLDYVQRAMRNGWWISFEGSAALKAARGES